MQSQGGRLERLLALILSYDILLDMFYDDSTSRPEGRHARRRSRHRRHGIWGDEFTSGRKFEAADLQLVILAFLAERPAHGYELIKTIEERSGGFYTPSPGVIYPALTYLSEIGHASVEQAGTSVERLLLDVALCYSAVGGV